MLELALGRIASSWIWYGIRASGFVSAGLLVVIILLGIGQVTGFTYRFIEPIKAWAIHKAVALSLCVGIFLHISLLLIDKYNRFSLSQILIPFLSNYNNGTKVFGLPLGGLAITFGILAMYGIVLIVSTSLGWIDSKKELWKKVHYVSYPTALFIILHVLYTGTDVKRGLIRSIWIILAFIVLAGFLSRLRRNGSLKNKNDN